MATSVKNLTPRQLSTNASLLIAGIFLLISTVLYFIFNKTSFPFILILTASIAIVAYFVNLYFLKHYIFRKIKLIYKTIHKLKLDPSQKLRNVESDENIISNVDEDVAKWAEDQEQQIDQLKTLENYRREFLGNVSHELKTPIFNIQGYVHTLIDGGLHDESINTKYLQRTAKNVERLITIVDDLEAISKLESGQLALDIRKFDIRELTLEVFETYELTARQHDIKLMLKEGADQAFMVNADREFIRQVLDNLISNSIKYGTPGGSSKVAFYDMDKNILVEVADNGIGMGEEHLNHVFDRFYRVDKSRSRAAGGSGLGLSIVKHIMEAHNQTINVRSSLKAGSTFGFTLEKA